MLKYKEAKRALSTMANHRLPLSSVVIFICILFATIVIGYNATRFQTLISSSPDHEHEVSFAEGKRRRRLESLVNADETTRNSADASTNSVPVPLDHNHNPILVLGLPRSGSLAVHNFFSCNGIRSSHYCCSRSSSSEQQAQSPGDSNNEAHDAPISFPCGGSDDDDDSPTTTCGTCVHRNMGRNQKPFQDCGDYQVYSQFDVETGDPFSWFLPQHFALPLLHEAYPDSTWILNRRGSSKQWATNVLHWYSVTNRLFQSFGIDYYHDAAVTAKQEPSPDTLTQGALVKEIQKSFARMHNETDHARRLQSLQDVYEQHLDKVRAYAAHATSQHTLIEINVDDPVRAGNTLAEAFPGTRAECFQFDAAALDNDWRDFSLQV
jgi:hypothetical protein